MTIVAAKLVASVSQAPSQPDSAITDSQNVVFFSFCAGVVVKSFHLANSRWIRSNRFGVNRTSGRHQTSDTTSDPVPVTCFPRTRAGQPSPMVPRSRPWRVGSAGRNPEPGVSAMGQSVPGRNGGRVRVRVRRSRPNGGITRGVRLGIVVLAMIALIVPSSTRAAPPPTDIGDQFVASESAHFRFLVAPNTEIDAAGFLAAHGAVADRGYTELAALFGVTLPAKIPVYVYAEESAWADAVVTLEPPDLATTDAVADVAVGDIALPLGRFLTRSPLETENAFRHATAHLLLGVAAAATLPRGFTEGMAQYVERPNNPKLARMAAILQGASQQGRLLSWSDLNRARPIAADPDAYAAQSYAVAAFLIDRYGVTAFREYLTELATEPDWRTAMRTSYKRGPQELEDQWKEQLPRWTASGWKTNLVAAFDLQPARDLLERADYAGAKDLLERSQRLYTDLGDQPLLAQVDELVALCDTGLQAEALMTQTQQALEHHTYDRAQTLLEQARTQYTILPEDQRPSTLLDIYARMATAGVEATTRLDDAQRLSHRWGNYPEARAAAVGAGTTFATLGDEEMLARAGTLLDDLDARQRRLVLMLAALAALTTAWLALWLWARGPAELDWT